MQLDVYESSAESLICSHRSSNVMDVAVRHTIEVAGTS